MRPSGRISVNETAVLRIGKQKKNGPIQTTTYPKGSKVPKGSKGLEILNFEPFLDIKSA